MRAYVLAATLLLALGPATALADKTTYTVDETDIGVLLDDPVARAILDKNIPGFSARDGIDQARPFTLNFIQGFPQADITDAMLKAIQADFDRLAATGK